MLLQPHSAFEARYRLQSELVSQRYVCFNVVDHTDQWIELSDNDLDVPIHAGGLAEEVVGGLEAMPRITQEDSDRDRKSFDELLTVVRARAAAGDKL